MAHRPSAAIPKMCIAGPARRPTSVARELLGHRLTHVGEPAAREFRGAAKRGGTELGLRCLLERDQERDGGFGVWAEGQYAIVGEQDGPGARSLLDQIDDGRVMAS